MSTYQFYRSTTLGQALTATLDDMVREDLITPALYNKVLVEFDSAINKALATKVKNKITFKAERLRAYRFCDNVWTFLMDDVDFRDAIPGPVKKVKFVACDGQVTKAVPVSSDK